MLAILVIFLFLFILFYLFDEFRFLQIMFNEFSYF